MYARYIPPKKDVRRNAIPAPLPRSESSSFYARYIPPPDAKKRKIVFDDAEDNAQPIESNQEKRSEGFKSASNDVEVKNQPVSRKKQKKSKGDEDEKTKKPSKSAETKKQSVGELASVSHNANPQGLVTESVNDLVAASPDESKEEKKAKQKKKKLQQGTSENGVLEGGSDDVAGRHKSVLKKKEKSLSRAKDAPIASTESLARDSEHDPAPVRPATEVHGLEPLPQPEPLSPRTSHPSYETLPAWLASPLRVSPDTRAPFSKLGRIPGRGISAQVEKVLQSKGWKEAFAIQTAAIPALLPSQERQGDLVISAATGSGKTLAYVLPLVRDISQSTLTRLRAIIVVPTKELVFQVQDVCETCSRAYATSSKRVKIGIAVGSSPSFEMEQAALMEENQKYDPVAYKERLRKQESWRFCQGSTEDVDPYLGDKDARELPEHVVEHSSKVDILICTPGRLVKHINETSGFTLDFVRWLVIDEADKLLGQSFNQWREVVMEKLSVEKCGARIHADSNWAGVRKVVLSATMTRDLSLLSSLKLSRPTHLVLEGTQRPGDESTTATEYALPEFLEEAAIKVKDESLKPLYLLDLLKNKYITTTSGGSRAERSTSESSSERDDTESTSSDDETSAHSTADDESEDGGSSHAQDGLPSTALVFTKSNENALRLSRLLSLLSPSLAPLVGTLTSTTRTSDRGKTLRAFAGKRLRVLVASDLAARGIDLPELDHVINYDMPPSVESYVHRVGRTARAGHGGHAWTLFTKKEAGWFWPEVAGQGKGRGTGGTITRSNKVEKVTIGAGDEANGIQPTGKFGDERVAEYEAALERLGKEATDVHRRGKGADT